MRGSSWSNATGSVVLELDLDDEGNLCDLQSEKGVGSDELNFLRPFVADPPQAEIVIHFTSSGYYDPGSMWGGSDGLGWAPEGADDREFESAEVLIDGKADSTLPKEIGLRLFSLFEKQINAADIEDDRHEIE